MKVVLLILLMFPFAAYAQTYRINPLPIIYVTDLKPTVHGNTITGSFRIRNNEQRSVGNIVYELQIIQPLAGNKVDVLYADDPVFYDRFTPSQDPIGLSAESEKIISFTYEVPNIPNGEYRLRVRTRTTNDRQMGWLDAPITMITSSQKPYGIVEADSIDVVAVDPITHEKDSSWAPRSGPNVDAKSHSTLRATITNPGNVPLSGDLTIATKRSLYANQDEIITHGQRITIQPGKKQKVAIPIIAESKPGAYRVVVSVVDGKRRISGSAEYRYVVNGVSASVVSVLLHTVPSKKGGEVTADFTLAGSADRIHTVDGVVEATISDMNGNAGTTSNVFHIAGAVPLQGIATIPTTRTLCGIPAITMTLKGKDGLILDTFTTPFPDQKRFCSSQYKVPAIIAILIVAVVIFIHYGRVFAMSQDFLIRLQCTKCKAYNYHTRRNLKKQDGTKLERSKYCKKCREHTVHKEKAKK